MPPKVCKTGQQTSKIGIRRDAAKEEAKYSADDASSVDSAGEGTAGAGMPTNSDILSEIRSLKQDITKQSADVMEAINGIKVDIESHATRQRQREFDGVKARFRSMDIRYGMLYPAHLVITHDGKRRIFKTVSEAEEYLRRMLRRLGVRVKG